LVQKLDKHIVMIIHISKHFYWFRG